jgi:hypothetical protein
MGTQAKGCPISDKVTGRAGIANFGAVQFRPGNDER